MLKRRWKILKHEFCEPPKHLNRVVLACCALHNFIRLTGGHLDEERENMESDSDDEQSDAEEFEEKVSVTACTLTETIAGKEWRDQLAARMWEQYVAYLQQQGRLAI